METINRPANVYASDCASRQVLDFISDKWTPLIMLLLEDEPKRFSVLRRTIDGISQKMLTQTLRHMERNGLVSRTVYPEVPPRVEYELTPLGKTLCAPMQMIVNWAETHIDAVNAAQTAYDVRENQPAAV